MKKPRTDKVSTTHFWWVALVYFVGLSLLFYAGMNLRKDHTVMLVSGILGGLLVIGTQIFVEVSLFKRR
jgi:hypothetical protein